MYLCGFGPEHLLSLTLAKGQHAAAVQSYCDEVAKKSERDRVTEAADAVKTGVFSGAYAVNPVNQERIPIWIADYVLVSYGTGAVFACPAHDERDYAFAKQFDLPIREVVSGGDIEQEPYVGDGAHINSDFLDGLNIADAKTSVIDWLEQHDHGKGSIRYRLRDWLFFAAALLGRAVSNRDWTRRIDCLGSRI